MLSRHRLDHPPLATIPENRVYVSPLRADAFIAGFLRFSGGRVVSDDRQQAPAQVRAELR